MPNLTAPLDITLVRARLAQTRFHDVRYLAQTASTNADAQQLLGETQSAGATLVAEFQTAGVGRKGRPWIAPRGSALLFTTILPEPLAVNALWAVPFWISLGVAEGIERATGIRLDLVWPNDLFAHARKVGGILSVARVSGELAWVGCGVGLDVVRPHGDTELDALEPAPIFLDELGAAVEREAILADILLSFERKFEDLYAPQTVARAWEQRAELFDTPYRYRRDSDGVERSARAVRLGADGRLVVRDDSTNVDTSVDMADVRVLGG